MGDSPAVSLSFESATALGEWYASAVMSGGIFVELGRRLEPGEEVKLELAVGETVLEASGRALEPTDRGGRISIEPSAALRKLLDVTSLQGRSGRVSPAGDKRRHARCDTFLRARFRHYAQLIDEYVANISNGGMFVRTDDPPPVGATVKVHVTFPDGDTRSVTAQVVRSISSQAAEEGGWVAGAGVVFRHGAAEVERAVEALIAEYLARPARVLVIDDSPFFLRVLCDALMARGVQLIAAEDGYEGSRMIVRHLYDLDGVVLDLNMPGLTGWTLLERIGRLATEMKLKVFIVSGQDERKLRSLVDPGVLADVIHKSTPVAEIAERIRNRLRSPKT